MRTIMPAFGRYGEEGLIVGRLVTGYGELEFNLAWATAWLCGSESTAFKVMFRAPGEEARIRVADALVRDRLPIGKLRTRFEQAIAGMHVCRKIRNHYAHCQWGDDATGLWFVDLQEIADRDGEYDTRDLSRHIVDVTLLREQEAYFCHVMDCLSWLAFEGQVIAGHLRSNPFSIVHLKGSPPPLHR